MTISHSISKSLPNSISKDLVSNISGGVSGDGSLHDINSSACCDIDATFYDGSTQNMLNKVTVPADGSLQADYKWFLGATAAVEASDPTFNVDRFDHDGGDFFRDQLGAGNVGVTLNDAHKTNTGNAWTIFVAHETAGVVSNAVWGNTAAGSQPGVEAQITSAGTLRLAQSTGATFNSTDLDVAAYSINTDFLTAIAFDFDTNIVRTWINSETSNDFSKTFATTTNEPIVPFDIMATAGALIQRNGAEFFHFSVFNTFFSDAEYIAIKDQLATRTWGGFITW